MGADLGYFDHDLPCMNNSLEVLVNHAGVMPISPLD
jgi:hypothetical protein